MDLFMVPTISFRLLHGFLILRHSRREILWLGMTAHPSAQWIARQLSEAYGWQQAPQYIVRDRDCVAAGAGGENLDLQPHGAPSRFNVSQRRLRGRSKGRIDEHSDTNGTGHQLTQKFQPLLPPTRL
jgi:hypothetical protein